MPNHPPPYSDYFEKMGVIGKFSLHNILDELVKSQKSRHSCESRSPELLELTGFPLSRE